MTATRFRDGPVTVTLTGDLEGFIRKAVEAASGGLLEAMEATAADVAGSARASWYGPDGVQRETGRSGDVQVVTTVERDRVRVSVGSTDERKAGGKPVVVFVHRPGKLSMVKKSVSREEYYATPTKLRANYRPMKGDAGPGPFVWEPNPRAGDGKHLLEELVKKPMRRAVKERLVPEAKIRIARKLGQ